MARPYIISALDIGSSKIATLIAQKNPETGRITVIGAASLPSKGIKKGQIINIDEVTQTSVACVEAAERMAGVSIGRLIVNISSVQISSLNSRGIVAVSTPGGEINQDDVIRVIEAAQAVSLPSTQEILHVLPMNFTLDAQTGIRDPIGMSGVRLEVDTHIIMASSVLVRNIAKCVSEIGAQLDQVVFNGVASSYSTLTETEKELGVVTVDIGGGTTDLAIYSEGSLAYSAVIPVGAKNITSDLAIGLRVSLESAEKIKLLLSEPQTKISIPEDMLDEPPNRRSKLAEKKKEDMLDLSSLQLKEEVGDVSRKTLIDGIIRPRLNEIFDLVGSHIKKSGLGHAIPSGLVICGGGAMSVDLLESAKRRLALPSRVGTPSGVTGLIEDVSSSAYATTIGLLLFAMEQDATGESSGKMSFGKSGGNLGAGILGKITDMIKSLLP